MWNSLVLKTCVETASHIAMFISSLYTVFPHLKRYVAEVSQSHGILHGMRSGSGQVWSPAVL